MVAGCPPGTSVHSISLSIKLSRPDWRGYDVSSSHAVPTPGKGTMGQQSHCARLPQSMEEVTTGLGSTKNTAREQRNAQRHPELSTPRCDQADPEETRLPRAVLHLCATSLQLGQAWASTETPPHRSDAATCPSPPGLGHRGGRLCHSRAHTSWGMLSAQIKFHD